MRCVKARLAPCLALGLALGPSGCGDDSAPDPLDPELIRELSLARGEASGDTHTGQWLLAFQVDSCDCPNVEIDANPVNLCAVATFAGQGYTAGLIESGGVFAIPSGPEATFGVLTGAIEADGSFDVASRHNASTVLGPLESLARMDGAATDDSMEGWAGQRLIGEIAGTTLDCRWMGSFVGTRLSPPY
ncbi:hypothetical protein [Enhygromyxa salina]|uniref:Lipoprotein n=1 Tax=Enhygromyxa salina TaxID=215803 RepID=A0A2S9XWB2_9BACT|nr:hypothetical protein [Enhygromyxa salina]PRP97132.1 hypothetical protein ENSA7_67440 [Enhygromyxa salina]